MPSDSISITPGSAAQLTVLPAGLAAPSDPVEAVGLRARHRLVYATGLAAAGGVATIATGGVTLDPPAFALFVAWSVIAFAAAGALWHRGRPWSPFGALLVVQGLLVALDSLYARPESAVFSLGFVVNSFEVLLAWWLVLAFPSGRLDRLGRAVFAGGIGVILFGFLPLLLVSPRLQPPPPIARCAGICPDNALSAFHAPGLVSPFWTSYTGLRSLFAAVLIATLVVRYARASQPRRRVLLPVYIVGVTWLACFLAYGIAVRLQSLDYSTTHGIGIALSGTRAALPLGFMGAIVLARAHAGAALQSMVRALAGQSSAASLEQIVRETLQDPSARLAFWLPHAERYSDLQGRRMAQPADAAGESWRSFHRGDEPIVAIVHDGALDEDPELVEAAGAATVLALENNRLQHDLRRTVADLRASRRRLVTAGAAERRRIERDLHDSTQQRLHALRIHLELARERTEPGTDVRRRLTQLGDELEEAIDELRGIAHGIYPPLLAEAGLREALSQAAHRTGVPVALELQDVGRVGEEVENAIYYCCLEAMQNAAKHAGPGATMSVRLALVDRELRFSVGDDGVGFATRRQQSGAGLTNMADRIGAIGGTLAVHSAPNKGTQVEGSVRLRR